MLTQTLLLGTQSWRCPRATFPDSICVHLSLKFKGVSFGPGFTELVAVTQLIPDNLQGWSHLGMGWHPEYGDSPLLVSNSSHEQCPDSGSATLEHTILTALSLRSWEPHFVPHISWKIDKQHKRISAKPYSLNVKTVLYYKRNPSTLGWKGPTRITKSSF